MDILILENKKSPGFNINNQSKILPDIYISK